MILSVDKLRKGFGPRTLLNDISLELREGMVMALCGPSGAGKTTLVKIIAGLLPFDAGALTIGDQHILASDIYPESLFGKVGVIFQDHNLFPHLSASQNIELALRRVRRLDHRAARARAVAELDRVGLREAAHQYPASLSGGERQRVAIARALAMDPLLLLLDETTSFLDSSAIGEVLKCIWDLSQSGVTMLLVTHNLAFAKRAASQYAILDRGELTTSDAPELLDQLEAVWV